MDDRAGCALADDDRIGGWAGAPTDFRNATCERVLQRLSRSGERCGSREREGIRGGDRRGKGRQLVASWWVACVRACRFGEARLRR
jgi:hypothetical protein